MLTSINLDGYKGAVYIFAKTTYDPSWAPTEAPSPFPSVEPTASPDSRRAQEFSSLRSNDENRLTAGENMDTINSSAADGDSRASIQNMDEEEDEFAVSAMNESAGGVSTYQKRKLRVPNDPDPVLSLLEHQINEQRLKYFRESELPLPSDALRRVLPPWAPSLSAQTQQTQKVQVPQGFLNVTASGQSSFMAWTQLAKLRASDGKIDFICAHAHCDYCLYRYTLSLLIALVHIVIVVCARIECYC